MPAAESKKKPMFYTVKEVAELCHVSSRTVYRLSRSGTLPRPIHLGKLARWRVRDVEKALDSLGDQ